MSRLPAALAIGASLFASAAAADVTGSVAGDATITRRIAIDVAGEVAIRGLELRSGFGAGAPLPPLHLTTTRFGENSLDVRLTGEHGDTVSLAVPRYVTLQRRGGPELIRARLQSPGRLPVDQAQILSSGESEIRLEGDLTRSIKDVVPGDYSGIVLIIAQWN